MPSFPSKLMSLHQNCLLICQMREEKENTRLLKVQDPDNVNYLVVRKTEVERTETALTSGLHECLAPTAPDVPQQLLGRAGAVSWDRSSPCGVQREIPLPRLLLLQPALSKAQIKQLLGAGVKNQCLLWGGHGLGKAGVSCSGSF